MLVLFLRVFRLSMPRYLFGREDIKLADRRNVKSHAFLFARYLPRTPINRHAQQPQLADVTANIVCFIEPKEFRGARNRP